MTLFYPMTLNDADLPTQQEYEEYLAESGDDIDLEEQIAQEPECLPIGSNFGQREAMMNLR
mgnify:CR=1 FL=1